MERGSIDLPSIFTHSLIGVAACKILPDKPLPKRFWVLSIICPSLPDADVISFAWGIPYEHILGHRGFTHSIFFALLLGILTVAIFFRKEGLSLKRSALLTVYFALITTSHSILDGLTNGDRGVALFFPFDHTRYFFPFRPIEDSPIGLAFFGERTYTVIKSELIWVWIPVFSTVIVAKVLRSKFPKM